MLGLVLDSGLSWASPPRDIKILYIHNAIDKLIATVRKDNIHKYYTFACIAF